MERDNLIFSLIEKEHQRQLKGIELIASENFVSDQVMEAMGSYCNMQKVILATDIMVDVKLLTKSSSWLSTVHVSSSMLNMQTYSHTQVHRQTLQYCLQF